MIDMHIGCSLKKKRTDAQITGIIRQDRIIAFLRQLLHQFQRSRNFSVRTEYWRKQKPIRPTQNSDGITGKHT